MTNEELLNLFTTTALGKPFKIKQSTLDTYSIFIGYLLKFVDNKNLLEVTKSDIKQFMLQYQKSDSYYNAILSSLKCIYKVFAYLDLVESDCTFGLFLIRNPKKEKRVALSQLEEKQLLKGCKNVRDTAIITLMLRCGLRISEMVALTLEQYMNRTDDNMILLTETKRDKERVIFLNDEVIDAIESYLPKRKDGCDKLFVSDQGTPMERISMSRTLKVCARRGGVDEDRIGEISNHTLRRTSVTDKLNNGVSIEMVARVHGHSSLTTTLGYFTENNDRIRQAMA